MAKKCFFITFTNCIGQIGSGYYCAEDLVYLSGGSCGGGFFSSADLGFNRDNASEREGTVKQVSCDNCPGCCSEPLRSNQPFDCINGNCLPKSTYGTPGKYSSLAACQGGCAKDSNCTGECIDPAEIAALQQAAAAVRARLCG